MKKINYRKIFKYLCLSIAILLAIFVIWQWSEKVPTQGNWQDTAKLLSTAQFNGNLVTVKNIRNFQYDASNTPTVEAWYDKTYDLNKLVKVWYIVVPFNPTSPFAHTFLSFQFSDGSYLAISIEARLMKNQEYSIMTGLIHTFPLMYIAADERDVIYDRASISKDDLYLYPLRATPADGRLLLTDMLDRMNDLSANPTWYNGIYSNCTSNIAASVNKIWPGLLPTLDWEVLFTSYSDKLALDKGLLDTNLPIDQARKRFYITNVSQKVGYVPDYSELIREPGEEATTSGVN